MAANGDFIIEYKGEEYEVPRCSDCVRNLTLSYLQLKNENEELRANEQLYLRLKKENEELKAKIDEMEEMELAKSPSILENLDKNLLQRVQVAAKTAKRKKSEPRV